MNATTDTVRRSIRRLSQRGGGDIRDPSGINASEVERAVSILVGGVCLVRGFSRRSLGGTVLAMAGGGLAWLGLTGHSTIYQKLNLHTAGGRSLNGSKAPCNEMEITRAMTIGRPAEEPYRLWRDPQIQKQIAAEFADVTVSEQGQAHWVVRAPLGRRLEWDTHTVEEHPNELLGWATHPGAALPNEGSVQFRPAPGNRGTEVVLRVCFSPPGGLPAAEVMKLLGFIPRQMA